MRETHYWGYRVDASEADFFARELEQGRLRQGWGFDEGQNLRNMTVDKGAGRNRSMYQRVKKGDLLLVPRLPEWGLVAIARATEDWDTGYRFAVCPERRDYGHIFPAEYLAAFARHNALVAGDTRSTLKTPSRFWNINHCGENINALLAAAQAESSGSVLSESINHKDRMETAVRGVFSSHFNQKEFSAAIYQAMNANFQAAEWEFALVHGLRAMFPFYQIERVGGRAEKEHGADILVRLPGLFEGEQYAIAIQVKDYQGLVGDAVVEQINRADAYFSEKDTRLIEKIVIITGAKKDENLALTNADTGIRFVFAQELEELLLHMSKRLIGIRAG